MRNVSLALRICALTCLTTAYGCAGAGPSSGQAPLRVGTTGDFPPFSLATGSGYVGIDIELARDLGRTLGRPVEFVRTTFATVTRDAIAHRFDLAMSGINNTDERALAVDFSRTYHDYGRVAVVRCNEQARFSTLDDINRADVRIRVRSGGTTAQFARERFARAIVQDTASITSWYGRLAAGEDDVIVASAYEYRAHPELCLAAGGVRFWMMPIAVLLPKGSSLREPVNAWLERRLADGTVARLLSHYGVP